ncbi:hypothetical protein NFC81_00460 [Salinispirillum sp. LH 10-3-1]|uniref:Phage holin family protein n=1 Tax=Salinispirillum sp. LH 10-3-1 TaxID=2952525 RepID=A0AB38YG25_9GAMM
MKNRVEVTARDGDVTVNGEPVRSPLVRFMIIFCAIIGALSLFLLVLLPLLGMAVSLMVSLVLGFLAVLSGLVVVFILVSPFVLAAITVRSITQRKSGK